MMGCDDNSFASGFARRDKEFAGWPVGYIAPNYIGADARRVEGIIEDLTSQVERMRAALQEIANLTDVREDECGTIHRRALDEAK